MRFEQSIGKNPLGDAQELMRQGEPERLPSDLTGLWGELPISALTYLLCFADYPANAIALPLRQGNDLACFRTIQTPILGVIGDQDGREHAVILITDAIASRKRENSRAEEYQAAQSDVPSTGVAALDHQPCHH
jgi:hypothetical protein